MANRSDRNRKEPERLLAELIEMAIGLDLTALSEALPELLRSAEQDGLSFSNFARKLFEVELLARRERKRNRSLKRAHLGTVEGLDGFDFALRSRLEPRVIREMLNCRFVEERRNIICVGRPGLGKTRIAKALAHAACLAGYDVLFTSLTDMLEDLHGSLADDTFKRVFRRYTKPAVVVLDEFGYQPLDRAMANNLFRIVSARHEHGSIVLTANTGFAKWKDFFPSEAQAVATVDRLVDRATILRFTGKTCRKPKDVLGAPLDDD